MDFIQAVKARRSIRRFLPREISDGVLWEILDAARLAPSAKNRQPWFFTVLKGMEKQFIADLLNEKGGFSAQGSATAVEEASVVIAVSTRNLENIGYNDVLSIGAAVEHICLAATAKGLGSLWICDVEDCAEEIRERLKLDGKLICAVALGVAAEYPDSRPRRELSELCKGIQPTTDADVAERLPEADVNNGKYVFMSYSHRDKRQVIADITELKHHNIPLFYDRSLKANEAWDKAVLSNMRNSNCIGAIFYLSPDSVNSPAVLAEFTQAVELEKSRDFGIIAVHLGGCPLSDMHPLTENAFLRYYGTENKRIFIGRSYIPEDFTHLEGLLDALKRKQLMPVANTYDRFEYVIGNKQCTITKYIGFAESIKVPSQIVGLPVTEVGGFGGNTVVKRISLPNTVKTISLGAFNGCSSLEEVIIPDSVTEIKTAAFRDCVSLTSLTLPPKITYLAEALMRGCRSLTQFEVPYGVTEMGEAVFNGCSSLWRIVIPPTVKSMTEGGFFECISLSELTIPTDIIGLDKDSFATCPLIKNLRIGSYIYDGGKGIPV